MRSAKKHLEIENDLSASFGTDSIDLEYMTKLAISIKVTTSDANGTFKVQGRNHSSEGWVDISGLSSAIAGANKDILINMSDIGFTYARVYYTKSSGGGAGTECDIRFRKKGESAQ